MDAHSIRLLATKSGKPQTRGYHPTADDALLRWLDERKRLGLAKNGTPLFCTLEGGPVSDDYLRNLLRRLAAKAGIDKRVHPHGLRHTFAWELEQSGTPVTVISKLLGHSSIAVTARYLDHLTNGQAVAALQAAELPPLEEPPAPARLRTARRRDGADQPRRSAPNSGAAGARGAEPPRKRRSAVPTQSPEPVPARPAAELQEPQPAEPAPAVTAPCAGTGLDGPHRFNEHGYCPACQCTISDIGDG
jgi:hypothetical protein